MHFQRTLRYGTLLLALAALLPACAPRSVRVERPGLSNSLQQHTGFAIRTNATTTEQLPAGVEVIDGISSPEAVAIALWNNAGFQENLSKLGLVRGDLAQAGQLSNPTFSVLFPLGPKQLEFAATFPLEAVWLRPRRVAIANLDAERIAEGLVQNGLDLVRDTRVALSDLELARDRMQLAWKAVALRERIAAITRARERAGDASQLDSVAADAEVARARDEAQRTSHDAAMARERLLFVVGLADTNAVFSPLPPTPELGIPLAELERRALAARPDLRASELAVEAAAKRAGLAKAEFITLSGIIDANGSGKEGFEIGPGAQVTVPIFNQNQAGRARAAAEVERAAWNCVGTQRRVRLEVREACANEEQAARALRNWSARLVPSLEELVRNSEKAYELGELSPLTVQENARQLLMAHVREAELRADLRRARAELERSVGVQLRADIK